jgi:hypothetical protein
MSEPVTTMWAPNGVRVESIDLTVTGRQNGGLVRGGPRLPAGRWLIISAPSGVMIEAIDADGEPAATAVALAKVAADLAPCFQFDIRALSATRPTPEGQGDE